MYPIVGFFTGGLLQVEGGKKISKAINKKYLDFFFFGRGGMNWDGVCAYFFFLHKVDKSRPLDFHRLPLPVVQGEHEVEEIGLSEVGRGLLLVVRPGQADSTAG